MASTSLTSFCNKEEFVWITIMTCKILPTSKIWVFVLVPACLPALLCFLPLCLLSVFPPSAPFSKGCFFFLPTFSFPSSFPPSLYPSLPIFFPPILPFFQVRVIYKRRGGKGEMERNSSICWFTPPKTSGQELSQVQAGSLELYVGLARGQVPIRFEHLPVLSQAR